MSITQEYANQCFDYDPDTGILKWKHRPIEHFKSKRGYSVWNARYSMISCGHLSSNGYLIVSVNKSFYAVHRIIWLIVYGYFPIEIDHINHNRTDNRIDNLRCVNRRDNCRNQSIRKLNNSGVTGISFDRKNKKWRVVIGSRKTFKHIGRFSIFNDAVVAAKAAHEENGFHPNHGKPL